MSDAKDMYQTFLAEHQLPESYANSASRHFEPVAQHILALQGLKQAPYVVALNGCQGSGKSTLADFLVSWFEAQGKRALAISLDDFYLTKAERQRLAKSVHPLFETRGVPGTHDTKLMTQVLTELSMGAALNSSINVPRFNKAADDRVAASEWTVISEPQDIIILEGWCWGARHQSPDALISPVNELEAKQDEQGQWRSHVNEVLKTEYEPLYALMDCWLMLKAPSFDCVYQWRLEQEQKLQARLAQWAQTQKKVDASGVMSSAEIQRFIQFYQRITEQLLTTLPDWADVVWSLSDQRQIQSCLSRNTFSHLEGEQV